MKNISNLLIYDLVFYLALIYALIILTLPLEIISLTSFYASKSPEYINYSYFSYNYTFLYIPIILISFLFRKRLKFYVFFNVFVGIFIFNVIYSLFAENKVFEGNLALFYIFIIAESMTILIIYLFGKSRIHEFLYIYVLVIFSSQMLRMALGYSELGRFSGMGLSVGTTGYVYAAFIVFMFYAKPNNFKNNVLIFVALIGLLLSGQRTNLILLFIFMIPYFLIMMKNILLNRKVKKDEYHKALFSMLVFCILGAVLILIFIILASGVDLENFTILQRYIEVTQLIFSNSLSSDGSLIGRTFSLGAGLQILFENPFGISHDFYDLQHRMEELGYPTFPHHTLLSTLLLWSTPVALVAWYYLIKLFLRLSKLKSNLKYPLLYIIVANIIWGGPMLNFQMLFFNMLMISICYFNIKSKYINNS
jgi:hypothetical protein